MAVLGTTGGAIVLPTGFAMDVQGLDIDETEQTADVTAFGTASTPMADHVASGTLTQSIVVTGFVNGTAVGFGTAAAGGSAAGSFTCGTSRAVGTGYLVHRKHVSGTRIGPFWACTLEMINTGALSTHTL